MCVYACIIHLRLDQDMEQRNSHILKLASHDIQSAKAKTSSVSILSSRRTGGLAYGWWAVCHLHARRRFKLHVLCDLLEPSDEDLGLFFQRGGM